MEKMRGWFLWIIGGFAVIGMFLISYPDSIPYLPKNLVTSLGEALVIAAILASTVDIYVKRKLGEDIARDVSPFILGRDLPSEFRDVLREIMKIEVFRKNFEIDFEIAEIHDHPGYVLVTTTVKYEVENLAANNQDYTQTGFVQKTPPNIAGESKILGAGVTGLGDEFDYSYSEAQIAEQVEENENERLLQVFWKKTVSIPPNKGGPCPVFWGKHEQILTRQDADTFYFVHPTLGATVRASAPPNLIVTVDFGHQDNGRALKIPKDRPRMWELKAAFLPWQSIAIDWRVANQSAVKSEEGVP